MALKNLFRVNPKPQFFLSTAREYVPLAVPHACFELGRMTDSLRDDYMLVRVEPSFRDEQIGHVEVDRLILSTRLKPHSLYPIKEWPAHVYVARVIEPTILKRLEFTKTDVELIAWGTLFRTLEDARVFADA